MKIFLHFFRRYRRQSLLAVLGLVLAALAEGAGLASLLVLLVTALEPAAGDSSVAGGAGVRAPSPVEAWLRGVLDQIGLEPDLVTLLTIFVLAIVFQGVVVLIAKRQVGFTVAQVSTDQRLRLLRALASARWSYFADQPSGRMAASVAGEANRSGKAYLACTSVVAASIQALLYITLAFTISWKVSLGAFVAGAITMRVAARFVSLTRRVGEKRTKLMRSLLSRLSESLAAVKPLKAMGRESLMASLLRDDTQRLNKALRKQVIAQEALKAVQGPLTALFGALGIYLAVTYWNVPVADLLVLALLFTNTQSKLSKAQRLYQGMTIQESAVWSLNDTIERAEAAEEHSSGTRAPVFERRLALEGVDVRYGDKDVLRGASLDVPHGRITALIGPSGAGKTTIIDLLTGLIRPSGGRVLIDDVPLAEIDLHAWRTSVGYVPQETFLLNDSVRANVTLGESVSDADVELALERAGIWDHVASLPEGMATEVGERGALLSGGQRQRIAIARALLHGSRLLILDEATAALDPETEREVWASIERLRGDVTVVAVSHQPRLTDVADLVYRVDDGRVVLETPAGSARSVRR